MRLEIESKFDHVREITTTRCFVCGEQTENSEIQMIDDFAHCPACALEVTMGQAAENDLEDPPSKWTQPCGCPLLTGENKPDYFGTMTRLFFQ